jgi:hypothetical protein
MQRLSSCSDKPQQERTRTDMNHGPGMNCNPYTTSCYLRSVPSLCGTWTRSRQLRSKRLIALTIYSREVSLKPHEIYKGVYGKKPFTVSLSDIPCSNSKLTSETIIFRPGVLGPHMCLEGSRLIFTLGLPYQATWWKNSYPTSGNTFCSRGQ